MKFPPVELHPDESAAFSSSAELGVLPFRDLRPAEQLEGKKPLLIPLLIWNQRIGRYVTGNQAFEGDVAPAVTRAVAEALSGGRFGAARLIGTDPERATPEVVCRSEGVRWVASGAVHDLYGTVYQQATFLLIPSYWVFGSPYQNRISDPVGVVRVSLRIDECGRAEPVFDGEFRSERRFHRATASDATRRALDHVAAQISSSLGGRSNEFPEGESLPGWRPL